MTVEKSKPISPQEALDAKQKSIPSEVIDAFNELIARNNRDGSITIKQKDVVALIVRKGLKSSEIFSNGWLDVEDMYREAGWIVVYDKPGFNESYEPTFSFRPAMGRSPRRE